MARWFLRAFGNARGKLNTGLETVQITPRMKEREIEIGSDFELEAEDGKFADSLDSFVFIYQKIDPAKENFRISCDFSVREAAAADMSGYGVGAIDSAEGGIKERHRNYALTGRFRTKKRLTQNSGVRIVSGYSDPECRNADGRITDASREFGKDSSLIHAGENAFYCMEKTDTGFTFSDGNESVSVKGTDFLTVQDESHVYAGIAAAGKIKICVSSLSFERSEGRLSKTEEIFTNTVPPYPELEHEKETVKGKEITGKVFVSPYGRKDARGFYTDPMDLEDAVKRASDKTEMVLLDGVYRPDKTVVLAGSGIELRSENEGRAVIDGSRLKKNSPAFAVTGDENRIAGIKFMNAPSMGLLITGSDNRIEKCTAEHNGDTGILICSLPGCDSKDWPSWNLVADCDSHHNRDVISSNADGFGAKLRIGDGNMFFRCIAYENADDGFDLYTKKLYPNTGAVTIECCLAYENGTGKEGSGFKLGGEGIAVAHEITDCIAFRNASKGFHPNSNPSSIMKRCSSRDNPGDNVVQKVMKKNRAGKGLVNLVKRLGKKPEKTGLVPSRKPDGSIELGGLFEKGRLDSTSDANLKNSRKKILFLISSLGGGGAERVCVNLANEMSLFHDVTLMHLYSKDISYEVSDRVKVVSNTLESIFAANPGISGIRARINRFKTIVRHKREADTCISFMKNQNFYNAVTPSPARKVMSERNDPSRKGRKYFLMAKFSYGLADRVVFQSEKVRNMFSERVRRKSVIIHNPVDVKVRADEKPKKRIVTAGRLNSQKNHEMLIRAFRIFHETHPEHTLTVYGEGELRKKLERLIEKHSLKGSVFLPGFKSGLHEEMKDAGMFVLSSDFEGLSNALMEAMMMGLAVITTDCTGSDELVEDGRDGLVVKRGDVMMMADAMARLADDEKLRKSMAEAAFKRAEDFRLNRIVMKWWREIR